MRVLNFVLNSSGHPVAVKLQPIEKYGRPERTRTVDLYRVKVAFLGFTTTYKTAGTAKVRGSRIRHRILWVGLWVGNHP
jgi:hypothetical protein